ncbi:MAG: efflux RND transporter periplasmic adaptor subunit [Polyangiales bacterium]
MTALRALLLGALTLGFGECNQAPQDHSAHGGGPVPSAGEHAHGSSSASGYAPIMIDPSRLGPLGMTTAKVEERELTKHVRTVGVIALDETKTAHVHAKVKGFIESLSANFVSKQVKAGENLCALYSQAVYAAELEYLALLKTPAVTTSKDPEISEAEQKGWSKVVEASRRRLMLWDVPRAQIDRMEKTGEPSRTYPIYAPRAGTLVAKQAVLGTYVEPGTELFTISDLTNLWALVDVYENDLPDVKLGDHAQLTIEGVSEPVHAMVSFVSPSIDESTRTLKVRFDVKNDGGKVRPGAFVTAELDADLGRGLAIPESAVVRTGARNVVFLVHGGGAHVEPREVTLGPLVSGYYRVEKGLASGDEVATGAQFLLDSESRLRATGGGGGHGGH